MVSRRPSVGFRVGCPFSAEVVACGHSLVTLPLTVNETLKRLSSLPILMHGNRSGGDGVGLGTVYVFPHLLGSRSPPVPLRRQLGVRHVGDVSPDD